MKKDLVSIVVPTFNCQDLIEDCLKSIKKQTYKNIELIIVDSFSTDNTPKIAKKYGRVYSFGRDPKQKNIFAVPYQRNYGAKKARGEFVYYADSDMRIRPRVVESCVRLIEKSGADAVIVPEKSFGEGFWTKCKCLEKECYRDSKHSYAEAARFVRKKIWDRLKGLDATLGGEDDWDFQMRLNEGGYKTVKLKDYVLHYEGRLTLRKVIRKKYIYGKSSIYNFRKHSDNKIYLIKQYSPIRLDFFTQYNKLLRDPVHAIGMIVMKIIEYTAGFYGLIYAQIKREEVKIINK